MLKDFHGEKKIEVSSQCAKSFIYKNIQMLWPINMLVGTFKIYYGNFVYYMRLARWLFFLNDWLGDKKFIEFFFAINILSKLFTASSYSQLNSSLIFCRAIKGLLQMNEITKFKNFSDFGEWRRGSLCLVYRTQSTLYKNVLMVLIGWFSHSSSCKFFCKTTFLNEDFKIILRYFGIRGNILFVLLWRSFQWQPYSRTALTQSTVNWLIGK